ncbi:MAG: hypothetical protein ABIQ27_07745 [Flavobacterium sp.]|uniref:hypothetical protein n=1 Tax=Flavobacterium sp. TaxID=239 RepID=UPI0032669ED8
MNPSKMVIGEKYKIERNHKVSKVVLKSITDSSIVVSKGWKEKQIPLNEITNMRKRKLSVVKSVVMPLAVTASAVLVFALSFSPGMGEISLVKGSN